MVTFKPKSDKKITSKKTNNTNSLDETHRSFMTKFHNDEHVVIPKLKNKKQKLIDQIEKGEDVTITTSKKQKLAIEKIKNKIKTIDSTIKKIKKEKEDYFLNNAKHISDYFESKQNISQGNADDANSNNNMMNFFKVKKDEDELGCDDSKQCQTPYHKYMSNVSNIYLNFDLLSKDVTVCIYCKSGELIPLEDEGNMVCNSCGASFPYLIDNDKPSYKEPPKEICSYAYKRINHFKEVLLQFQGKETINISDEIIDQIKKQVIKERITAEQLTYEKTKEILKKLSLNWCYEHIAYIRNIFGIPPPELSSKTYDTLLNLFGDLQIPYARHVPAHRINFLNHYYAFYKLCELLGEKRYLQNIPLLKDRSKIIDQDLIWKKMCADLNWKYIATV